MLNPDDVRRACAAPPEIGLVAASASGYAEMEDFLIPAEVPHDTRMWLMQYVHRAGDPGAPPKFDFVIFEPGLPCTTNCYTLSREAPEQTVAEILAERGDLSMALARHFAPFRKPVLDQIVHGVCRENALFALATALPNIIPNVFELPWAVSEFVSDTAFITLNQVRMAYLIAAASGRYVGLAGQKPEVISIAAAAFGWRAIARELAGKIPLGGGLIAKAAVAYAGSYVIGKGLERFNRDGYGLTPAERRELYAEGLEKGRAIAQGAADAPPAAS